MTVPILTDLSDSAWVRLLGGSGRCFVVHKLFAGRLITEQHFDVIIAEGTDTVDFNLSDVYIVGQPTETLKIDCLRFVVPSHDVVSTWRLLSEMSEMTFADGTRHFRLHGSTVTVVLTIGQKDILEASLLSLSTVAEKRANDAWLGRR